MAFACQKETSVSQIGLAFTRYTFQMCMWQEFQRRPCNDLPKGHNEVRDITADLLTETCYDVASVAPTGWRKFSSEKQQSLMMRHGLTYQQEVSG